MENAKDMIINHERFEKMELHVYSRAERVDKVVLAGRQFIDADDGRCTFVQNAPRGPRSVEIGRTPHCRIVRRPDGGYTTTLRVTQNVKYLKETLLAEIREVADCINKDLEEVKIKEMQQKNAKTDNGEVKKEGESEVKNEKPATKQPKKSKKGSLKNEDSVEKGGEKC